MKESVIPVAFAFIIVPAIALILPFVFLYYFVPYAVSHGGTGLIYSLLILAIIELTIYLYVKLTKQKDFMKFFVIKDEDKNNDKDSTLSKNKKIKSYYPFCAHLIIYMFLLDKWLKATSDHTVNFVLGLTLAPTPILMSIYAVHFYWETIVKNWETIFKIIS
ncbi:MAG: hypothetical protein HQL46_05495 [Gammaproteobacteria bacterium]|nr:hypothetical protein [Gammaproteobacteria bacterium]